MAALLSFMLVLVLAAGVARWMFTRFGRRERQLLWIGFFAHVFASVAQVYITRDYYGGGDMLMYYDAGAALRDLVLSDFGTWAWPVLDLAIGGDPRLPLHVIGVGTSTGAISGICAWALLLGGGSMYGVCLIFAVAAFYGQVCLYRALREIFPAYLRTRTLLAVFFVPSVVFWSSGILKEPIGFAGLGLSILGLWRLLFTGQRVRGAIYVAAAVPMMAITKPYYLFVLVPAAAIWLFWSRRAQNWSPQTLGRNAVYLLLIALALAFGLQYLGELFPFYAVENVMERVAYVQGLYYQIGGNSTYVVGEATAEAQISNAPLALVSVLARPFIFEVHNIVSLVSALEMTAILILLVRVLRVRGIRQSFQLWMRSPVLVFFVVFVVLLGTGVGLGAPNLGSISRYRIPIMPFYVLTLLALLPPARRNYVVEST